MLIVSVFKNTITNELPLVISYVCWDTIILQGTFIHKITWQIWKYKEKKNQNKKKKNTKNLII